MEYAIYNYSWAVMRLGTGNYAQLIENNLSTTIVLRISV